MSRVYESAVCNVQQHPCSNCICHQNCCMGWLRLVGSLKSQVSFAEYGLFYRALSQKRPIILRSLLIVATPYRQSGVCCDIFIGHFCRKKYFSDEMCESRCTTVVKVLQIVILLYMCTVTRHQNKCGTPLCASVCCDSFICATWLIHICNVTHSYELRDSSPD